MQIFLIGMNHKSAPLALRERFAFAGNALDKALESVRTMPQFCESAILSTCNRTEIYGVSEDAVAFKDLVADFLAREKDVPAQEFKHCLYALSGPDAVGHLFRVVCGLDSMVVGENEILGQVKKAYQRACAGRNAGKLLHRLFQRSFYVGKSVRSTHGNSYGDVSVSSVAVDLAKKIFDQMAECKAMIVGAGQTGEQTVKNLMREGVRSIVASNRSLDRARELAREFGGEAVTLEEALPKMADVDIVISSTASPHILFSREQIEKILPLRQGKPIFFIDIAVPRDMDPRVNELENVFLYNLDDLQAIAQEKSKLREQYVAKSMEWIAEEMESYFARFVALDAAPSHHVRDKGWQGLGVAEAEGGQ